MSQTLESAGPDAGTGAPPNPSAIMQIGMGFWPSKTLLSAVELGLYTLLAQAPLTGGQIADRLELRSRAVFDFLDGLVALRLLERDGSGEAATYSNTPDTAMFLDATARTTSAGSSRWPTRCSTASGAG